MRGIRIWRYFSDPDIGYRYTDIGFGLLIKIYIKAKLRQEWVKYVRPKAERRGPNGRASASRRRAVGTTLEGPRFSEPQASRRDEARRAELQRAAGET